MSNTDPTESRQRLAEIVHDAASSAASDALSNNDEVAFLIETLGWTQDDIDKALDG